MIHKKIIANNKTYSYQQELVFTVNGMTNINTYIVCFNIFRTNNIWYLSFNNIRTNNI